MRDQELKLNKIKGQSFSKRTVLAGVALAAVLWFGLVSVLAVPEARASAGWAAGKFGKTYDFNGQFYVDAGNVYNGVQSVAFWTKGTTYGGKVVDLNGVSYISISAGGVVSTTFASPTIYIDGVVGTTIDSNWHYVVITTNTAINASAVKFGSIEANNLIGMMDDVKMFNYALSLREINEKYRQGSPSAAQGGTVNDNSAYTALTVQQSGAGNIMDFKNSSGSVFTVASNGDVTANGNSTLSADKSLKLTGGVSFPASPTEGQIFFRTDTKQLYVYANAKWQADRSTATLIVAANDSQNKEKADYVATGANDQTQINAAITALPANGGLVYLLDGTYNIGASVTIAKSNVTLTGSGNASKLFLVNGANTNVIVVGNGATAYEGITISSLQVDGNKGNNSSGGDGIYFNTNITKSTIEKVYLHDVKSGGIDISQGSNNNKVTGNIVNSNGVVGINIYNSGNITVSNNYVYLNGYTGITVRLGTYSSIIGNRVENNGNDSSGGVGISVSGSNNNVVIGNNVLSNPRTGIEVYQGNYNTIESNTIYSSSQAANNTYYDIYIYGGSGTYPLYNIVSGNTIQASGGNKSKYGIYEADSNVDYNTITNNTVIGPVTGAILAQGAHTTVSGNKTGSATEGIFDIQAQANATQTALTVTQSGAGNIVNLTDNFITSGKGIYLANQKSAFAGNALELDVAQSQLQYGYYYNGSSYTDYTREVNSKDVDYSAGLGYEVPLLTTAATDNFYFGNSTTFDTLNFSFYSPATSATLVWEYCSALTAGACTGWTALTVTDGTTGFTTDGKVTWTDPGSAWLTGNVNSSSAKWLRVRATALTGAPKIYYATISIFTGKYLSLKNAGTEKLSINDQGDIYNAQFKKDVWTYMASIPKGVSYGSPNLLAYTGGDYIFALNGTNGNPYFYRYSISGNSWTAKTSPVSLWGGQGFSGLVYTGGDYIYALRGNVSPMFSRYSISGDSWSNMTGEPNTVDTGSSLVYTGGDYIYALRGGVTTDFYRYSISGNSWASMASSSAAVGQGGALIYTGGDYIYAFRGNGFTDFYRYSISGNSWSSIASTPATVSGGGALSYTGGNYIYAFGGNVTNNFWRYSVSNNSWVSMTSSPNTVSWGGSMAYTKDGFIYALSGNRNNLPSGYSTDFWRYSVGGDTGYDKLASGGLMLRGNINLEQNIGIMGGNVGIGTTTPVSKLDVRGTIENGLVGWWPMDEGTGTTVSDHSINNNTLTFGTAPNNPAWTNGKLGKSLSFNGNQSFATNGAISNELKISGDFTITAWVNPTDATKSYSSVAEVSRAGGPNAARYALWLHQSQVYGVINNTGPVKAGLQSGVWQFVAYSHNSATHTDYLWLNESKSTYGGATIDPGANLDTLRIGMSTEGPYGIDGKIDEVRIYNRVLSDREMAELYRQSSLVQGGTISDSSAYTALTVTQNGTGAIINLKDGANNTPFAITDGGVTTLKPTAFDTVYTFDGVATYADNTAEAKTSGGTAFAILSAEASSNDEFYLGLDHPFNTAYFNIATAGAGVTLSGRYWNGTIWTSLTITDNTANLTASGAVTFTAPADWAAAAVNGITKYWIDLRSPATNITTAPTANSVSPTTGNRFYVYGQSGDANPAFYINDKGNIQTYSSSANTSLTVNQAGAGNIMDVQKSSASVFTVGQATVNMANPFDLQVEGDVGMEYNLNFLNNNTSYITSAGPLTISAGNPNSYNNLTLKTSGTGDIIMDISGSTNGFRIVGAGGGVFSIDKNGNVAIGGVNNLDADLTVKRNIATQGGNLTIAKLATPANITVTVVGTAGVTTYGYRISAINGNGETVSSATVTTATGNATLSAANYNQIAWDAVSGATGYKVYGRTSGAELYMATVNSPALIYNDDGTVVTPAGALPSANTTGGNITGLLSFSNAGTALAVSANAITVTQTYHSVNNGGAGGVTINTINGGTAGNLLVLRNIDAVGSVTLANNAGNLKLAGVNCVLANASQNAMLIFSGTNWLLLACNNSNTADLAENYYVKNNFEKNASPYAEAGDVVRISGKNTDEYSNPEEGKYRYFVEKTEKTYDDGIVGIISTSPNTVMGAAGKITRDKRGNELKNGPETVPVALSGRVPVKVSLENGKIEIGDFLTSSSTPGVAMKATASGRIVGRALEPFDGTVTTCNVEVVEEFQNDSSLGRDDLSPQTTINEVRNNTSDNSDKPKTIRVVNCAKEQTDIGKVMAFVELGWQAGGENQNIKAQWIEMNGWCASIDENGDWKKIKKTAATCEESAAETGSPPTSTPAPPAPSAVEGTPTPKPTATLAPAATPPATPTPTPAETEHPRTSPTPSAIPAPSSNPKETGSPAPTSTVE